MVHEGVYVTQRVQHAPLETHCAIAWRDADGVLNVRSSTQVPFLTRRALVRSVRSRTGQGPSVLRTGRRRLRRQAGDADRRYRRAGGAQDRASGPARVDAGRAVRRDHHAPPDAGCHQGRRAEGRHADGAADAHCLQHRGLRQSRRPGSLSRLRRVDRCLSLPEQEDRRRRGLYQQRAGRRVSRLWQSAIRLRRGVGDRRARARHRHGPDRVSPAERSSRGRGDGVGRSRSTATSITAATASSNASTW